MQAQACSGAGKKLPGCAYVILHVAAPQDAAWVRIFELGKDGDGGLTESVRHHVQAPTMAHAHHGFFRPMLSSVVQHFIQEWNEDGDALEGKTLGAELA